MLPDAMLLPAVTAIVVGAYAIGMAVYLKSGKSPWLHAVLVSTVVATLVLQVLGIDKKTFQANAVFIDLLLGPAIVALAVPLFDNFQAVRRKALSLTGVTVLCGALIGASTFVAIVLVGASTIEATSISLRSITAPVGVAISKAASLDAELTMLSAFITGLVGVLTVPPLAARLGIRNEAVLGFTLGVTAHTFGIAKAVEISPRAVAFATVGMGLTAIVAAIVVPFIV